MPKKPPINIGFVGAGWMGNALLGKFAARDDVAIRGLHQRSQEKAETSLKSHALDPHLYRASYQDLLQDPEVDTIVIATPNHLHGQQAIAALEAEKHVFCEKPCATEYSEYLRQLELAAQHPELVTFVDYLMNFDTMERELVEMVKRDAFGTLTQVQVNYRHPVNISGDKKWKLNKEAIGDAIGQGIIHSLSIMSHLLQAQGAAPVRVYSTHSSKGNRPFEVPAVWNIQIEFDNGATGFCFGNIDHANGYDAYHNLHGTKGGFIFDSYLDRPSKVRFCSDSETNGNWIYPLDPDRDQDPKFLWPESTTTPDGGDVLNHQTGACVDHFLDCILRGEQSSLSFQNSSFVADVGWASLMSAETQQPVALPLNSSEALDFFSRPPQHSRIDDVPRH